MTSGAGTPAPWDARQLELELVDASALQLVRLVRHAGGEWDAPPAVHRNERVDPPAGHKDDYAVLYMARTLEAVAMECRVLHRDVADRATWDADRAKQYRVIRYKHTKPAIFAPIDGRNRHTLGLGGEKRAPGYAPFQQVALEVFQRYGEVIHGLSWESFHRGQPARVYALWHHHKASIGLEIVSIAPYPLLIDDAEWNDLLAARPEIERDDP